ncbi:MAG: DUF3618 domain-containing protein [Pyrinomonadaceae bacterium]|nr:DUF3618 domain-containing protein [Pyrinomonadaceae bacterium]
MGEKSSQLDEITAIDTDSTEDFETGKTSLQTRTDDSSSTAIESNDTETADEATDETEQIREQIVETRRGMSETIDAIQEKLSFSNISEQVQTQVSEQINNVVETAKDVFYGKATEVVNSFSRGLKDLGNTDLVKKARQNPAALAIIGAGIGALLIGMLTDSKKRSKGKKRKASFNYEHDSNDDEVRYSDNSRRELKSVELSESSFQSARNKVGEAASSTLESVSDAASSAYAGAAGAAGLAFESVGSAAGKTYDGVSSVAGKTYQGIGSAASKSYAGLSSAAGYTYEKAGDLGGEMKVNYDYYIEQNPLAVGAVALALGAAVGFAIPLTKKENEYLGEYRDSVVEKAQATAQDALGSVKQMATEAQKFISEEVKSKAA